MFISLITTWVLFGSLIAMNLYLKRKDWCLFLLSAIVLTAIIIILGVISSFLALLLPMLFYAAILFWLFLNHIRPKPVNVKKEKKK